MHFRCDCVLIAKIRCDKDQDGSISARVMSGCGELRLESGSQANPNGADKIIISVQTGGIVKGEAQRKLLYWQFVCFSGAGVS